MDKNIAALLRNDARTIQVVFDQPSADFEDITSAPAAKSGRNSKKAGYTYVTNLAVQVGDLVIVPARGRLSVAVVHSVDDEVQIEPNSDTYFQWVHSRIDESQASANAERNLKIEQTVSEAYRANLRRSFAQQILSGVEAERRDELAALLGYSNG